MGLKRQMQLQEVIKNDKRRKKQLQKQMKPVYFEESAENEGLGEPAHHRSLLKTFTVRLNSDTLL